MVIGRSTCFVLVFCLLNSGLSAHQTVTKPNETVDFQRVVRPILSDNCFHCHGPDPNTRLADLRLDTREGAYTARENGTPVVPRNLQASLVYQRIMDADPARRMPPKYSHKSLTAEQKDVLKRWIEQGAPWKEHWSFSAPVRPQLPAVKTKSWARNPIDQFILAKLEASGLDPSLGADRRTLARRLSLDLTGLPPDPAKVEAFVRDKSKNAYEKLVDQLLASSQWGEHRARYWLDASRYADTHGIHVDNYREMWPYRDWVIRAFNRNLPFDRSTIEQLAGDLLPNRSIDQQIASGFHRCNVTTNEGGVIVEEVEAIYAKDRVDTTGTVWLGLTVGCATCHDHKFDPISTKDFYSLAAFFRNTTQHAMDGNIPDTPPVVIVPKQEDRARWSRLNSEELAVKSRMQQTLHTADPAFETWLHSDERRSLKVPLDPSSQLLALSLEAQVKLQTEDENTVIALPEGVTLGTGVTPDTKALQFGSDAAVELRNFDYFAADKPFSIATWIFQPKREDSFLVASQSDSEDNSRGWFIDIGGRVPAFRLVGDEGKGINVVAGFAQQLKAGTWNHLVVTYDGSREQAGLALYLNGKAIPTQGGGDQSVQIEGDIHNKAPLRLGSDGKRYFQGGAIGDFRVFSRVISEEQAYLTSLWSTLDGACNKPVDQLTEEERDGFHLYFLNYHDSSYGDLTSKLKAFAAQRREIRRRGAVTHVMEEKKDTRPAAHVLFRGQYDQPREEVEPNVPSTLPPMPASFSRNRLGLAQWLVDPSNPLTARVTVNRFWQEVFGTGLVKTTEDFGSQGEAPSHPELLDWLAVEFRESGWDIKRLFRLMVTSSTYRQSALTSEEKLRKDPDNRLLSRGPRFRMDGEMVRDYALAASGLLVPVIGGPSVKPYQPDGIWEGVAMVGSNTRFYKQDSGENLYRRSLYTFWKRSAPPASMEIFNASTRETCTVRRERTNTPLQALVTLNDPQFVEAARHLARSAILSGRGEVDRQFDFIASRLLARTFEQHESAVARRSYQDYLAYYESNPEDAKRLLSTGESKADESLAAPQFAALTMVANQVMNLDEVVTK